MRTIFNKLLSFVLPFFLAIPAALAAEEESVIEYRQSIMKATGGHMGAIVDILKGRVDHPEHLVVHAEALDGLSGTVGDAFAQRTEGGDTRAKADIWTMSDEFGQSVSDFENAAAAFLSAARSGTDAARAKLKALGDSCKGCHRDFREDE